jgi:hypothetical protein
LWPLTTRVTTYPTAVGGSGGAGGGVGAGAVAGAERAGVAAVGVGDVASGGGGGAAAAGVASGVPQKPHRRNLPGFSSPQLGHWTVSGTG